MNTSRRIKSVLIALPIIVLIAALAPVAFYFLTFSSDERQLHQELSQLPLDEPVALAKLSVIAPYHTTCVVDSYAVRSGSDQEESLDRIFGNINYANYKAQVIKRYSHSDSGMGFFPVADGTLAKSLRAVPGWGSYLRGAKGFALSRCHDTAAICLTKKPKDEYGENPIIVDSCNT